MKQLFLIGIVFIFGLLAACSDVSTSTPPPLKPAGDKALSAIVLSEATPTLEPEAQATATATALITPSPTPTATTTPLPTEHLLAAQQAMFNGNYAVAITQFTSAIPNLGDPSQLSNARLQLGMAQLEMGDSVAARRSFEELIRDFPTQAEPHFFLAQMVEGGCLDAIVHYEAYFERDPLMGSYRGPWIAACYAANDNSAAAITHYERALEGEGHFIVVYQNRLALARLYGQQNRFTDAATLYGTIRDGARTAYTRGEMGYFAAEAQIAAGDQAGGFAEYQRLLEDHPTLYSTYLGLVELVQADQPVDQFQRGLVDYHAEVYAPCVEAFVRYIDENSAEFNPEALRYLAYCYEGLGNIGTALETLDTYTIQTNSLNGIVEKADMLRRQGRWPEAIPLYQQIVDPPPQSAADSDSAEGEDTPPPPPQLIGQNTARPHALWWMARLHDWRGETVQAEMRYRQLATDYPDAEDSAHALFRAGYLVDEAGDRAQALAYWREAALLDPDDYHGQAALTWVLPSSAADQELLTLAEGLEPIESYYSLRAQHLVGRRTPFAAPEQLSFELNQAEADAYLRERLELDATANVGDLSAELRNNPHIIRGEKLWRMRQWEAARQELHYMYRANAGDPLASYQLAIYYRDIGLYRSSIAAAVGVMSKLGDTVFEAPKFIAGLAYPAYYRDLVLPEAEKYDYDPLLQFALLRQESLYESFATSTAVAQGLAQVIPDTGAYIAQVLAWPNFQNADLYKPYVGIAFGAYYLDEQLARFNEQSHAALAAYNGGPGNAANWYNLAGNDIDRYVETVTFRETRAYIERIYVGQAIYYYLYGGE
ncbi:MAG: transglycosylase SLT domain-containing protein [Candidatus Promineifilaceae bacterium]